MEQASEAKKPWASEELFPLVYFLEAASEGSIEIRATTSLPCYINEMTKFGNFGEPKSHKLLGLLPGDTKMKNQLCKRFVSFKKGETKAAFIDCVEIREYIEDVRMLYPSLNDEATWIVPTTTPGEFGECQIPECDWYAERNDFGYCRIHISQQKSVTRESKKPNTNPRTVHHLFLLRPREAPEPLERCKAEYDVDGSALTCTGAAISREGFCSAHQIESMNGFPASPPETEMEER